MSDIKIKCKDCGLIFTFSESDQSFYLSKGYKPPVRCKRCRELRKNDKYLSFDKGLGYKKSSIFDNAQVFGMPMPVEGGLYIEHYYIFEDQSEKKKGYIKLIEGKLNFVDNKEDASHFYWSDQLPKFEKYLSVKYSDLKIKLIALPQWWNGSEYREKLDK